MAKKSDSSFHIAGSTIDRLQAAKIFFSGELEARRLEMLEKGDLPFRILQYKRIVDPEKVTYPVAKLNYTRIDAFDKQLRYLAKHCNVVALDELVRRISSGEKIPDRTVALTFDGGWIDNFVYAYPALMRLQIPATFFFPTAFIGTKNYFWQDKILFALIIMKQAGLAFIPFEFISEADKAVLEQVAPGGQIDFPLIYSLISILTLHPPEHKLIAISVLGNLAQQLGGDLPVEPAFMSWDDVRMMQAPYVTFGSLSHTNSLLLGKEKDELREEYEQSNKLLKEHCKNVTPVFGFPEGIVPVDALETFAELGVTCGLGVEGIPKPGSVETPFLLLGRTSIFEGESYATEVFACKLWLNREYQ